MTWYRFWKKSGPMAHLAEAYVWLDGKEYKGKKEKENELESQCEKWAEAMPGGYNTRYSYGFQTVKAPPKKILEKMVEDEERRILEKSKHLELLRREYKKIS